MARRHRHYANQAKECQEHCLCNTVYSKRIHLALPLSMLVALTILFTTNLTIEEAVLFD